MSTKNSRTWWESYRETVSITKHHQQLLALLNNRQDLVQNFIYLEKIRHPNQTELWYLIKIIDEIQQDNLIRDVS